MTAATLHRKLEQLIGHRFDYLGEVWVLIEVLGDIDSVVLQRRQNSLPNDVQQNIYGMPSRRTEGTLTLAISDAGGEVFSQDIMVLLEGHQTTTSG